MTDHAAVNTGKYSLQCTVFLDDLILIFTLLSHINSHSHRTHHTSVDIIERRFVCSQRPFTLSRLDDLLGCKRLLLSHNLPFRFNTGRIIFLHVPYVGVSTPLNLLFCLIHCLTEAVIYFLMYAILVLVPDQVRNMINRSIQILARLPEILAHLISLLPPQKMKPYLLIGHGGRPYILQHRHFPRKGFPLLQIGKYDQFRFPAFILHKRPHRFYCIHTL